MLLSVGLEGITQLMVLLAELMFFFLIMGRFIITSELVKNVVRLTAAVSLIQEHPGKDTENLSRKTP